MRPWLALCVAATVLAAPSSSARQATKLSVSDAINLYARGDFDTAVRNLDTQTLRVAPFTRALDEWIATAAATDRPRRHLVAASFAIDANWTATRTFWNLGHGNANMGMNRTPPLSAERERFYDCQSQPFVAQWAVGQLAAAAAPDTLERALWLAAIGLTEDGHAWERLQRDILPLARKRLPDEPRLRLAEVLARTNRELEPLRTASFRGRDILRVESFRARASGPIANATRAFEPLLADASLAGEVELRLGYLELRRDRWAAALARFDAARSKVTEPVLLATTDYFAGWAFEQLEREDEAIAAYRRAVVTTPNMRNLATRLSALLYLRNEREEAYSVLDRALNARPQPQDLMVTLERADGRFVPEWLAEIRKALK